MRELASRYNISLDNEQPIEIFKRECQEKLECHFVAKWLYDINDEAHDPIIRKYKLFKTTYELHPYLDLVKNPKYITAISRIRTSSHMRPITPLHRRLCPSCNEIEDEKHFVLDFPIYRDERVKLYDKIHTVTPTFVNMVPDSKFIFLFTSNHKQIINWFVRFIYVCFEKRSKLDRGQISKKVN